MDPMKVLMPAGMSFFLSTAQDFWRFGRHLTEKLLSV
jgi:hypothetical protein